MRGSRIKSFFLVALFHAGRILPTFVIELLILGMTGLARAGYFLPFNPLRGSCRDVATLAARAGYVHRPHTIYSRLIGQVSLVLRAFVRVFKYGREEALSRVRIDPAIATDAEALLEAHGGLILAAPHNVCSLFASVGLPLDRVLVVIRNREGRHNRVSQAVVEQMRIETLEVRNLTTVALSRAMMRALSNDRLLVATLDGNYRKPDAVEIDIFGRPKGFGSWAARIAAKRGAPIVPCYPHARNGIVGVRYGEPLVDPDPRVLMEHYVRFFEKCILEDPCSWAFLGDKRWGRHLAAAARDVALTASG